MEGRSGRRCRLNSFSIDLSDTVISDNIMTAAGAGVNIDPAGTKMISEHQMNDRRTFSGVLLVLCFVTKSWNLNR